MTKNIFKKIIVSIISFEAKLVLSKYKPKIIMVTGSVGKTSTKDAVYSAVKVFGRVRKSEKSFNSELGVPLTILGLPNGWSNIFIWKLNIIRGLFVFLYSPNYPEWLILEVGADRPGDIRRLLEWITPSVVVISQLSAVPAHVENYPSAKAVIEEEIVPARHLSGSGVLVWNRDDQVAAEELKSVARSSISFGFSEQANVWASHEEVIYKNGKPAGVGFRVDYSGTSVPVKIFGVLGRGHIYSVLAAISVGISQGANFVSLVEAFSAHKCPKGRMNIISGKNGSVIIDDSYNSSPIALRQALETFKSVSCSGKKYALLGSMLELGEHSENEHRLIGEKAKEFCHEVFTVGEKAKNFGDFKHFENSTEAGIYLVNFFQEGDLVLVKGSQGSGKNSIRLERAVEYFMAEPERKGELLVRQEKEWGKK